MDDDDDNIGRSKLLHYVVVLSFSEFGADSDDDSQGWDDDEEREKLKRRKFILDEFKRRNQVRTQFGLLTVSVIHVVHWPLVSFVICDYFTGFSQVFEIIEFHL